MLRSNTFSFETVSHHSFMLSHKSHLRVQWSDFSMPISVRLGRKEGEGGRGLLKTEEGREREGGKKQVFSLANKNGRSNVALISKFPVAPPPPRQRFGPPGQPRHCRNAPDRKWRCPKKVRLVGRACEEVENWKLVFALVSEGGRGKCRAGIKGRGRNRLGIQKRLGPPTAMQWLGERQQEKVGASRKTDKVIFHSKMKVSDYISEKTNPV